VFKIKQLGSATGFSGQIIELLGTAVIAAMVRSMLVVLIVEDEAVLLLMAESMLQEDGYQTISASTVDDAIAVIEDADRKIDLLVTDLGLHDQNKGGLAVGQAAAKSRPGLPIVYTTARGVTDSMVKLFVEPNRYIPKPYTNEQLVSAAADLLCAKT
jgi:DNA-binding NtrC family response regulator